MQSCSFEARLKGGVGCPPSHPMSSQCLQYSHADMCVTASLCIMQALHVDLYGFHQFRLHILSQGIAYYLALSVHPAHLDHYKTMFYNCHSFGIMSGNRFCS